MTWGVCYSMPDLALILPDIQDSQLRSLARAIRTAAVTRGQAHEALLGWRQAVSFDSGDRLTIETLLDAAESLPE